MHKGIIVYKIIFKHYLHMDFHTFGKLLHVKIQRLGFYVSILSKNVKIWRWVVKKCFYVKLATLHNLWRHRMTMHDLYIPEMEDKFWFLDLESSTLDWQKRTTQ